MSQDQLKVLVVGVCASGKSSLVRELKKRGIHARHAAQEHSNVPWMWTMSSPHYLVVLEANYDTIKKRRAICWDHKRYEMQLDRLEHVKQHANLIIDTNDLTIDQVTETAMKGINKRLKEQ